MLHSRNGRFSISSEPRMSVRGIVGAIRSYKCLLSGGWRRSYSGVFFCQQTADTQGGRTAAAGQWLLVGRRRRIVAGEGRKERRCWALEVTAAATRC